MKYLFLILIFFTLTGFQLTSCSQNNDKTMIYNKLTPEEEKVILNKGTEIPYSGIYYKNKEEGVYICKRCNAPLYRSKDKFDAHCGWSSFDDEIEGAVKRIPDADGMRTEIVCSNCGAHLGHVFTGEAFTKKDTRHCVNSISLKFIPAVAIDSAIFAGGCFWGVEYYMKKCKDVISATSGYIGGHTENPSYKQVCTGTTGHAEAVKIVFNTQETTYEELTKLFFEIHDFEQVNRQGPDVGFQYRSAIFYLNDEQKKTAQKLIDILKTKNYKVATTLEKANTFWKAEDYHQNYYTNKGGLPYCHGYRKVF